VADFVILNLIVSGHLRDVEIEVPGGRLQWIAWRYRDKYPVFYQGAGEGRLLLSVDDSVGEREAQWISDIFSALIDLVHGPSGMTLGLVEVPAPLVASGEIVAEEVANLLEPLDSRLVHLTSGWWPTDDPIWTALHALPAVLASASGSHDYCLPAALLYYKLSTSEFAFLGDSVSWALSDEGHEMPSSAMTKRGSSKRFTTPSRPSKPSSAASHRKTTDGFASAYATLASTRTRKWASARCRANRSSMSSSASGRRATRERPTQEGLRRVHAGSRTSS